MSLAIKEQLQLEGRGVHFPDELIALWLLFSLGLGLLLILLPGRCKLPRSPVVYFIQS